MGALIFRLSLDFFFPSRNLKLRINFKRQKIDPDLHAFIFECDLVPTTWCNVIKQPPILKCFAYNSICIKFCGNCELLLPLVLCLIMKICYLQLANSMSHSEALPFLN